MTSGSRADGLRWGARSATPSASVRLRAAAMFGVLLAFTRNLTVPAAVFVVGAGAAVWLMKPDPTSSAARGVAVPERLMNAGLRTWSGLCVVFCLWELSAFLLGNDQAHPTFSMLTDPVLSIPPTRALVGFAWLAWGWHLAAG